MSLTTYKVEEVARKAQLALAAVEVKLSELSPGARSERARLMARHERLSKHIVEVRQCNSIEAQIESYGAKRWHQDYIKLADVVAPPECGYTTAELRARLYKIFENTKFGRFQRAVCAPENFIVPRFTIEKNGRLNFGAVDIYALGVSGCLVAPDRISDEAAIRLKLIEFTEKERTSPMLRLAAKAQVKVADQLKYLWDSGKPASTRDLRFLILEKAIFGFDPPPYNSSKVSMPTGFHGTIIYSSEDTKAKVNRNVIPGFVPLKLSHYVSVLDAERKTDHVDLGYRREQVRLTTLRTNVSMTRNAIRDWKRDTPKSEKTAMQERVKTVARGGQSELSGAVEPKKVTTRETFSKIGDGTDSLGRPNPAVFDLRLRQADATLGARFAETVSKGGVNERDRALLTDIKDANIQIFETVRSELEQNAAEHVRPRWISDNVVAKVIPSYRSLDAVTARPFTTYSGLMRLGLVRLSAVQKTLARIKKDLPEAEKEEVRAKARDLVNKLHFITRLCAIEVEVAKIKQELVNSKHFSLANVERSLKEIRGWIEDGPLLRAPQQAYPVLQKLLEGQLGGVTPIVERYKASQRTKSPMSFDTLVDLLEEPLDNMKPEKLAWSIRSLR